MLANPTNSDMNALLRVVFARAKKKTASCAKTTRS